MLEHFRFIARHQLGLLSELRQIPVDPTRTLGWIVHERVNLRSADFWFIEVSFHEVGHLEAPPPDAIASAMQWDAASAPAIFGQPAVPAVRGMDQSAVKLTRHGAIRFRAPELPDDQLELGLRAEVELAEAAVVVQFATDSAPPATKALVLIAVHATDSGQDRRIPLSPCGADRYCADSAPGDARFDLLLTDASGSWRIVGVRELGQQRVALAPAWSASR